MLVCFKFADVSKIGCGSLFVEAFLRVGEETEKLELMRLMKLVIGFGLFKPVDVVISWMLKQNWLFPLLRLTLYTCIMKDLYTYGSLIVVKH